MEQNSYVAYIYQQYNTDKHPVIFSEIYYASSVAGVVSLNFDQQGARAVFVQYLYFTPLSSIVVTFLDQYRKPLFQATTGISAVTNWFPIFQVKKGTKLYVESTNILVNFSVSYQYLM